MTQHNKKIRVAVLYGGRSGEHEISLMSAASVMKHLDRARYELVPISIDKDGRWRVHDLSLIEGHPKSVAVLKQDAPVVLQPNPASPETRLSLISGAGKPMQSSAIDVVFPVMHGTLGEDGTVQGLLELADIPYVGNGVLASAVGMDKDMSKRVARDAGIPVVPFLTIHQARYLKDPSLVTSQVESELGFPCFVKPASLGSSVGIHKVKKTPDLAAAIQDAFKYDTKVLIERGIDAREIELSVLEHRDPSQEPRVSTVGEIIPTHEFYSYEAKYLDENGAVLKIPAELSSAQAVEAQAIARNAFLAHNCEGMARVDLFLDRKSGKFYLNEINTIPGFTSISMYPKLWEASGLKYADLLSELIELAVARHERKSKLKREFHK